jgi:hypothetical protein
MANSRHFFCEGKERRVEGMIRVQSQNAEEGFRDTIQDNEDISEAAMNRKRPVVAGVFGPGLIGCELLTAYGVCSRLSVSGGLQEGFDV